MICSHQNEFIYGDCLIRADPAATTCVHTSARQCERELECPSHRESHVGLAGAASMCESREHGFSLTFCSLVPGNRGRRGKEERTEDYFMKSAWLCLRLKNL